MDLTIPRRQLLAAAAAAAVAPPAWAAPAAASGPLVIGGLPVTCNLTLPLACLARGDGVFKYANYSDWPTLIDALSTGRVKAAYMLAPQIMDMVERKIPVKTISLGHRSGAVIMVRSDSPYRSFKDLKGRKVAIPSRFAVDVLFLRRMLAEEGMSIDEVQVLELSPPDMPAALYAKSVDAYCTGEPFGAAAERAGFARVLRMTRDVWRNYICCVLAVREELIAERPELLQELVNHVQACGLWLDRRYENRTRAVNLVAGADFFNQDPKILRFVMDNPIDRVTYGDLRLIRSEFDELMQLCRAAGTIRAAVPFARYVDERFAQAIRPVSTSRLDARRPGAGAAA